MSDAPSDGASDDPAAETGSSSPPVVAAPPLTRRNLPMMMLLVRELVVARFRPLLHVHGLTEQQWRILRVVHDARRIEQRQISQACGISAPSLAGVLARMESLGLVKRARPAHDQRRVEVDLTTRSRELVSVLAPQIEAVYRQLESDIDPQVISSLFDALETMLTTFDQLRDADPSPPGAVAVE